MINWFRALVRENRWRQRQILVQTLEIGWAHVFHDSIRGSDFLQELPLNVGRWAGNYSFFYLLHRLLRDFKPKSILELGLGESSKLISAYLDSELLESTHDIIEHDKEWIEAFHERFVLSTRSEILHLPLSKCAIKDFESTVYQGLTQSIKANYDLYVIDGPFGTKRYSRYDLVHLVERLTVSDDFIIIFDDYNRRGEQDTVEEVFKELKRNGIAYYHAQYEGSKAQMLIASEKYRLAASL